jgi:hypothetical protein
MTSCQATIFRWRLGECLQASACRHNSLRPRGGRGVQGRRRRRPAGAQPWTPGQSDGTPTRQRPAAETTDARRFGCRRGAIDAVSAAAARTGARRRGSPKTSPPWRPRLHWRPSHRYVAPLREKTPADISVAIMTAVGGEEQVDDGDGPIVWYPTSGQVPAGPLLWQSTAGWNGPRARPR